MRCRRNALLALPALLSALVAAIPSPPTYLQQPLDTLQPSPQQSPSRWKELADRLVETIWRIDRDEGTRRSRSQRFHDSSLSRQTLTRYGGDVVLRFNISAAHEAQSLADAADTLLLDVWDFTRTWVDIRLSKDIVPSLLGLLPDSLQHSHTALFHGRDLAQAVYDTYPSIYRQTQTKDHYALGDQQFTTSLHRSTDEDESSIFFQEYRPLSVIGPWMRLLSSIFSTHVRLVRIGQSYEGREILAFRVGVHPTNNENPDRRPRKTVVITGGLHAREWISISTVNYVAFHLITSYGKSQSVTDLLEQYDFVFVPTVNPDGYEYSWETDRLWRKNRQQTRVRFCRGVDLDHGFGFAWDGLRTMGNPCSESYAGETPFDAYESDVLAKWARNETENNNVEFVGFMDLHSYSQQILYPYSYSCADKPPSQENLEELALGLEKAIRRSSAMSYESMPACEGNSAFMSGPQARFQLPKIEESGGSAIDWFYHEMHVRYAYQIKLRDRGTYGFLLPKENIVPTGKEILDAVLYFGEFLREGYPKLSSDGEHAGLAPLDGDMHQPGLEEDSVVVEDMDNKLPQLDLKRRKR